MLLSDLAFKSNDFEASYNLLKDSSPSPKQLLDFAYQNKKIENYNLAIKVYNDIIQDNHSSNTTISAILNLGDALEKQSMESKVNLPISKYFHSNQILNSPYYYVNNDNLEILGTAVTLYDSLYTTSKGSEAGFRLAEIKFSVLNDLDDALKIYNECIKYSKDNNLKFNSSLKTIDLVIAKGDLVESERLIEKYIQQYKSSDQSNLLKIKKIQIDFFNGKSFCIR